MQSIDTVSRPQPANSRPVVLLVEDEILLRFELAQCIRASDIQVVEVSTAEEAVELLRHGLVFHAVVADIRMPGRLDGLDLARIVRRDAPATKIVFVSGAVVSENQYKDLCDLFIAKPALASITDLLSIIRDGSDAAE